MSVGSAAVAGNPADQRGADAPASPAYRWYVLLLVSLCFVSAYVDRLIMSILQVPIKRDLGLSDLDLGLLNGLAFTLCYAMIAIPVGRLADRASRKLVLAAILAVWNLSTIACGLVSSFGLMFLCRVGVAVGEGGCAPLSMSLISDYFPVEKRTTAIAIWTLSVPLGSMLGYAAGGWLDQALGWRLSFIYTGLAGAVLVPLVLITLRNPKRGGIGRVPAGAQPSLFQGLAILWRLKSFRYQVIASSMNVGMLNTFLTWNVPFLVRSHGLGLREAASYMALAIGIGGAIGSFGTGLLTARLSRVSHAWYSLLPCIAVILLIPVGLAQLFVGSATVATIAAFVAIMLIQVYLTPMMALGQALVVPEMRAFTGAVQALCTIVLAGATAPIVAGWLSDLWTPHYGAQALRYAMATLLLLAPVGAFFYASASRHIRGDWMRING